MDPAVVDTLAPVFGMMIAAFVVSIPLLAWGVRFAAKPLVEALARYREMHAMGDSAGQAALLQDRRIALLEAEVQQLGATLRQVAEAEEFRRQLAAPTER